MDQIFLLLGTNQGALKANLLEAISEMEQHKIKTIKKSKIYKTKPWGNSQQPDFLNMAVAVDCDYSPQELLRTLKKIETKLGRGKVGERWGPRIIDIDILFYGKETVTQENLTIPHREFFNRPFALKLLAEISPDFVPPLSTKKLKDYLIGVTDEGIEIYRD